MKSIRNKPIREIVVTRMLDLLDHCIKKGIVVDRAEWCEKIGVNYRNFTQIRSFKQGFTDEQKIAAARLAKVDMNWIFGMTDQMPKKPDQLSPLDLIEEGLRILKSQNKPSKTKKGA
jgi:hypothetical protein